MNSTEYIKRIEWNDEVSKLYIVNNIFLVLYLVFGTTGNIVVIIIYNFRMRRKKDDRYFIPFLAVLDLFACVSRSSLELVMNLNPVNFRGGSLCKLIWFPTNVFAIASIFLLLVIALQRYLKICHPFGTQMTLIWKRLALGVCIIIAIIFSIPLIYYNNEIKVINPVNNITGYVCDIDVKRYNGPGFLTYSAIASISSLAIMIALTVFNLCIGRTIYKKIKAKHERNLKADGDNQIIQPLAPVVIQQLNNMNECISETEATCQLPNINQPKDNTQIQCRSRVMSFSNRYSVMFMIIGAAFIISYFPRLVILVVSLNDPQFFGKISNVQLSLVAFFRELNVVNNVVNPFVYGFFDGKFRNETKKLLCHHL